MARWHPFRALLVLRVRVRVLRVYVRVLRVYVRVLRVRVRVLRVYVRVLRVYVRVPIAYLKEVSGNEFGVKYDERHEEQSANQRSPLARRFRSAGADWGYP